MITVNIPKYLIVGSVSENETTAHYSKEAILAICAKTAGILN